MITNMKRKGSIAMYIEPWHADILPFLDLRKNHGKEELRARDLFLALWVNDLFMERVDLDEEWSLMCPHECPGLQDAYGDEFKELYERYEEEGKYKAKVKAREIWNKVLESQIETGTPYILYKDAVNEKSNQKNIGTIKSSNLCAEIVEYTAPDEIAVCNLASIALPKFVNKNKTYNFNKLHDVAYHVTINLNNVIDKTYYPIEEARNSNLRHRPIGLGVQGLADVFFKVGLGYDSEEARKLNKEIFETIYHAAIEASCDLAKRDGAYETYEGSPMSEGNFQFDLWGVTPTERWNWDKLRNKVAKHGVRNSLTTCIMPTASTANILGNEASCEAQTSNMYVRRVLSGEFPIVNKHLVKDLIKLKLWSEELKNKIIVNNGSIQDINEIPQDIKDIYKTVWEIKQKAVINLAADRGAFIDQTQSMNVFMANPNFAKLTSMHFYAWGRRTFMKDEEGNPILPKDTENIDIVYDKEGNPKFYREKKNNLKTGMYYLRTKAAADAVKFTAKSLKEGSVDVEKQISDIACSLDSDPGDCLACGS